MDFSIKTHDRSVRAVRRPRGITIKKRCVKNGIVGRLPRSRGGPADPRSPESASRRTTGAPDLRTGDLPRRGEDASPLRGHPQVAGGDLRVNQGRIHLGERAIRRSSRPGPSPHFSPGFYCGGGYGHVYCVALGRAPRRSVNNASGALGRAPCIHAHLHHLATNPGEKCGLGSSASGDFRW
jgi:hypothetical protein